ncbi:putative retrotransposon gag domain-containing protein [Helianthus annuus]|nr:putative retrotransposon gag domain-containing protein [Helianthus annuus]
MATPPSSRIIQTVQNDHDNVTMEDITHEEENENQVGVLEREETITPDFVTMHKDKLKKCLEDLERQEKVNSLRARLSFNTPSNQEGVDPQNKGSGSDPLETFMTALRQMSSEEREDLFAGKKEKGKEMEKEGQGGDGLDQPYLPIDLAEISKFTRRIAEAPMPSKTKLPPNFDRYDGTRDPEDHLHAFRGAGQLGRWPMPVWCHMFVQTLMEGARLWFDSLPPGGIDSYEELSEKFLRNFGQQRKVVKNPNEILHIRQRDNERVDQYMERFVKESMNIKDVPEVMKISSFINGVKHAQLCEKLGEEFPHSSDNLMDRVRAFVRGKEMDTTPRRLTTAAKPPEKDYSQEILTENPKTAM